MAKNKIFILLAALMILAVNIAYVSAAFVDITSVEVNGGDQSAVTAGETLAVRVGFSALENATDVRIKAWISGSRENSVSSERFDVYPGGAYSKLFAVQVPSDIDPTENLYLMVEIESQNGGFGDSISIPLKAQRESYVVEILDVNVDSKVQSGNNLALDIVLKNRGAHDAEDTFVRATIQALGVEGRAYFGDMSPVDQPLRSGSNDRLDKEDTSERRLLLNIPSDARPGVYTLQIEAYNGDSSTVLTKKISILGAGDNSMVVSSTNSKTFGVGDTAAYSITLVNSGNKIKVYELMAEYSDDNLNVDIDESVIAVPAGTSKTVKVEVSAQKAGKYNFAVNVNSGSELIKSQQFISNVQGSSAGSAFSGNTAVVLTIVLAIIFVVLLVVLIVLLTRKPEKSQELSESYY